MSAKILEKQQLSENVFKMVLDGPKIAKRRKAGQFVIIRIHDASELGFDDIHHHQREGELLNLERIFHALSLSANGTLSNNIYHVYWKQLDLLKDILIIRI